jgi:sulfite reductase (NADPH) flavoprotein alpha-component
MLQTYTKDQPFIAKIKERYSLCVPGSKKNTQHIVLDLKGSNIHYEVGDSIGVWASYDPILIENTLSTMRADGKETVRDRRTGQDWNLREYLTIKANISDLSKKLLINICEKQTNSYKKESLENLLKEENHYLLKEFLATRDLLDVLQEHSEVIFSSQDLVNLLMPMIPRFYSIASSKKVVGEEVHLTVALRQFELHQRQRVGVCTHFLCNLVPLQAEVPIYVHPHKGFTIPSDPNSSIIMVGPGTGIAPYRAFMQEREQCKTSGKNWLFFGEWNRSHHFFYEDYWRALEAGGKLRIDVAFSRDQGHKIYVQHRMIEQGNDIFQWLEEGAYFYVCGDATRMAKDVDAALHEIVRCQGKVNEGAAKSYIKKLKADKRYLRDVY